MSPTASKLRSTVLVMTSMWQGENDTQCILCSVCSDAAPNNFRMSDDEDHDICYKQPENEEELEQCYEAMENCPVEAIGDDG